MSVKQRFEYNDYCMISFDVKYELFELTYSELGLNNSLDIFLQSTYSHFYFEWIHITYTV